MENGANWIGVEYLQAVDVKVADNLRPDWVDLEIDQLVDECQQKSVQFVIEALCNDLKAKILSGVTTEMTRYPYILRCQTC